MAFVKGQSGNPGGRPKESPEVRELAKAHTTEAIERLAHWMRSTDAKSSVSSCVHLLNRAWGTPVQTTELTGKDGGPIETITNPRDAARAVLDILRQAQVEEEQPK